MKGDFDTSANEKNKMKVLCEDAFSTILSHLRLLCGGLAHLLLPSSLILSSKSVYLGKVASSSAFPPLVLPFPPIWFEDISRRLSYKFSKEQIKLECREKENRGGNIGGEAIFEDWDWVPINKQMRVKHHGRRFHLSFLSWLFPFPPSALPALVNGDLVRGCCVVLGEGWALVGLCGLGGATYWRVGGVGLGGSTAVHVLCGEQRHVCAKQILLDRTHC